jgi:hypothetical protein
MDDLNTSNSQNNQIVEIIKKSENKNKKKDIIKEIHKDKAINKADKKNK